MKKTLVYSVLRAIGVLGLAWSFWLSAGWLQLCAGLALFLFGMQCLEEGLRQLAGSRLEQVLAASTATPLRSLSFGIVGATLLQSSSLVVVLVIAFISTGLIQLAAGIAIVLGVNLGSSFGIWLLALAGQNFSLSPLAFPLLVLGVLLGFNGPKSKASGRVILGIAFVFMGVDQLKGGFAQSGDALDLQLFAEADVGGYLLFVGLGLLVTLVLQSSHATLMLVLAALSTGQLQLWQAVSVTLGANIGSSLSTAFMGSLNGNRSGQRLALVHVLFNTLTAGAFLFFLSAIVNLMLATAHGLGLPENTPLLLAVFQTSFNAVGILLFWPWQSHLERLLVRWLPEPQEPQVLITGLEEEASCPVEPARARYLKKAALASSETAVQAVLQELQHLERLSMEVICHALYQPISQLTAVRLDEQVLGYVPKGHELDAEQLYRCHIKGVYADLLAFMGRLEAKKAAPQQAFWLGVQVTALQLVEAVKDAKHLQKNLKHFLIAESGVTQQYYLELRRQLLLVLRQLYRASFEKTWLQQGQLNQAHSVDEQTAAYEQTFRQRLFAEVQAHRLDGLQVSSLMNDLGYVCRIIQSLHTVASLKQERTSLIQLEGR